MKTNETTPAIVLTEAEQRMIEIARQEKQLEADKKSAQKKIDDEKSIIKFNAQVGVFKDAKALLVEVTKKYFNELIALKNLGLYKLVIEEQTQHMDVYNWIYPEGCSNGQKEILAQEEVKYSIATIVRAAHESIYIIVKEHMVDASASRYHSRMESRGFKMYINGIGYDQEKKGLKKVETAHKTIQDHIDSTIRKNSAEEMEKEGWGILLATVKQQYPEAEVTKEDYYSSYNGGRGYHVKVVNAQFSNGMVVKYSFRYFRNDQQILTFIKDVYKVDYSNLDKDVMIEALINVPAKLA